MRLRARLGTPPSAHRPREALWSFMVETFVLTCSRLRATEPHHLALQDLPKRTSWIVSVRCGRQHVSRRALLATTTQWCLNMEIKGRQVQCLLIQNECNGCTAPWLICGLRKLALVATRMVQDPSSREPRPDAQSYLVVTMPRAWSHWMATQHST